MFGSSVLLFLWRNYCDSQMVKVSKRLRMTADIKGRQTSGIKRSSVGAPMPHSACTLEKPAFESLFSFLLAVYSFRCNKSDFSSCMAHTIELCLTLFYLLKRSHGIWMANTEHRNPAVLLLLLLFSFYYEWIKIMCWVGVEDPLSLASKLITQIEKKKCTAENGNS